jgi:hypothetical protein
MKTITFELSEEQFAHLKRSAECRHVAPRKLLKSRLIDLLEDPIDPFDPRGQLPREREEEFLSRIA